MKEISVSSVNVGNSLWGSATSISDDIFYLQNTKQNRNVARMKITFCLPADAIAIQNTRQK